MVNKNAIMFFLLLVIICGSGCTAVSQNTNHINQLRGQVANIETVLARQNLLIQQNKTEVDALLDRNDEMAVALSDIRGLQTLTSPSHSRRTSALTLERIETSSQTLLSDKLVPQPAIREVQTALRNAGFYAGNVDGKAGPMTRDAVKKFQSANGLTNDGIVGRQTWDKLKEYL